MTNELLLSGIREIVGKQHVLTIGKSTERFRRGFRSGEGEALCVVQPGSLVDYWKVLKACVEADKIIIFQAANTGLTEGSTPKGRYSRDVVVINTRRMDQIQPILSGDQVLAFPGATLFSLERMLKKFNRDPHSVIGSTAIGASIVGGVCNSSGGTLVARGPSYTELAIYARIDENGVLQLINNLGIDLGNDPESILSRLESGDFTAAPVNDGRNASASNYAEKVRQIDSEIPSRFNNDGTGLYEVSGCGGKLAVFALRLDTFAKPKRQKTFYIGTNDTSVLTRLRRDILGNFETLPISSEYMERELFDIAERYGKDTVMMIDWLGTDRLPTFFALKGAIDGRLRGFGLGNLTDHVMQVISRLAPGVLPKSMLNYREKYQHHLILKMPDDGIEEAQTYLEKLFDESEGAYFECSEREAKIAGLHRFAAAGAAVRYMAVHSNEVEDIIALDIALRRNDQDWYEQLPRDVTDQLVHKMYYGHLMCHVMHQDYVVKKGADVKALKQRMLELLDERGAEYPAEHNVGHLYPAKAALADHYKWCDPTNSFNPGIGKMSRAKNYAED